MGKALMEHYGNECKDRRQAHIIECAKMLEKIVCRGKEDISAMVIELDHIFGEFEDLGRIEEGNVTNQASMCSPTGY